MSCVEFFCPKCMDTKSEKTCHKCGTIKDVEFDEQFDHYEHEPVEIDREEYEEEDDE